MLAALNGGRASLVDLEVALGDILACFRPGRSSWLGQIVNRRIDRILFAATKADHLNTAGHDRLELLLRRLLDGAIGRAAFSGAEVDVRAIAAVRASTFAPATRSGQGIACSALLPVRFALKGS